MLADFVPLVTVNHSVSTVVTGASDGIGKGYAHYLARQGMAIVLVARNEAKLTKVAAEIKTKHGVETKIVVADFSKGAEIYPHLEKALVPLDIGILGKTACYVPFLLVAF